MKFQSLLINSRVNLEIENLEEILKKGDLLPDKITEANSIIISPLKNSIGIAQLKEIGEWINLKSFHSKFVIINNAEMLTTEAQNSLLKNLEEPPENTMFILISKNNEKILETIRSRCIQLISKSEVIEDSSRNEIAESFLKANYLEKLKIVEKLSKDYDNREEIAEIVFEIIKKIPQKEINSEELKVLKNIYIGIKGSVNLKLCLDLLCIYLS